MSGEQKTGFETVDASNELLYYVSVLEAINKLSKLKYAQLRTQLLICATKEEFEQLMSS